MYKRLTGLRITAGTTNVRHYKSNREREKPKEKRERDLKRRERETEREKREGDTESERERKRLSAKKEGKECNNTPQKSSLGAYLRVDNVNVKRCVNYISMAVSSRYSPPAS